MEAASASLDALSAPHPLHVEPLERARLAVVQWEHSQPPMLLMLSPLASERTDSLSNSSSLSNLCAGCRGAARASSCCSWRISLASAAAAALAASRKLAQMLQRVASLSVLMNVQV